MANIVLNREWLDQNAQRAYPLAKYTSRTDASSSLVLPDDFLVDLGLSVPASANVTPAGFFIRWVGNYSTGFSITVGYKPDGDDPVDVASANIPRGTFTNYSTYDLNGSAGAFASARGKVVIGKLENIDLQPNGLFEFELEGSQLETRAIMPSISGVTSIVIENQGDVLGPFSNVVRLRAGDRIKFELDEDANSESLDDDDVADVVIIVSAVDGTDLNEDCVCTETRTPIYTINGVGPDDNNNINIVGANCLDISTISHGIKIDDSCSTPCCSCEELEKITQSMELFGTKATSLENFLLGLQAAVSQMDRVVLGSRLNDRGCGTS